MTTPAVLGATVGALSDGALSKEVADLRALLSTQADQLKTLNRRLAEAHPETMTPQLAQTLGKLLAKIGAVHSGFTSAGGKADLFKKLATGQITQVAAGDLNFGAAAGFTLFIYGDGSAVLTVLPAGVRPQTDAITALGGPTKRWLEVDSLVFRGAQIAPAYGVNVTPDTSANDNIVTANNGVAFNVLAPINPPNAALVQEFNLTIKNTSGGALGVATFAAAYKMTAWVQPATGFNRTITFRSTDGGVSWVEIGRTAADVPN